MKIFNNYTQASICYTELTNQLMLNFLDKFAGDTLHLEESYKLETSFLDFVNSVNSCIQKASNKCSIEGRIQEVGIQEGTAMLVLSTATSVAVDQSANSIPSRHEWLLAFASTHKGGDPTARVKTSYDLTIVGEKNLVLALKDQLHEKIISMNLAQITWYYNVKNEMHLKPIILDEPKKIYPEFYPNFPGDISRYFKAFLENDATVLILVGPPGTGKTSLLRKFLHENHLNAMVTYDEKLFKEDQLFVDFITSEEDDLLIVEDADMMLSSRETEHNEMMTRFLNISDGMIKFPKKKTIFSTNLNSIDKVDPALVRPGRCFDILNFKPLTYSEAVVAAKVAGLPTPDEEKSYTLAELFNPRLNRDQLPERRIGFTS